MTASIGTTSLHGSMNTGAEFKAQDNKGRQAARIAAAGKNKITGDLHD